MDTSFSAIRGLTTTPQAQAVGSVSDGASTEVVRGVNVVNNAIKDTVYSSIGDFVSFLGGVMDVKKPPSWDSIIVNMTSITNELQACKSAIQSNTGPFTVNHINLEKLSNVVRDITDNINANKDNIDSNVYAKTMQGLESIKQIVDNFMHIMDGKDSISLDDLYKKFETETWPSIPGISGTTPEKIQKMLDIMIGISGTAADPNLFRPQINKEFEVEHIEFTSDQIVDDDTIETALYNVYSDYDNRVDDDIRHTALMTNGATQIQEAITELQKILAEIDGGTPIDPPKATDASGTPPPPVTLPNYQGRIYQIADDNSNMLTMDEAGMHRYDLTPEQATEARRVLAVQNGDAPETPSTDEEKRIQEITGVDPHNSMQGLADKYYVISGDQRQRLNDAIAELRRQIDEKSGDDWGNVGDNEELKSVIDFVEKEINDDTPNQITVDELRNMTERLTDAGGEAGSIIQSLSSKMQKDITDAGAANAQFGSFSEKLFSLLKNIAQSAVVV